MFALLASRDFATAVSAAEEEEEEEGEGGDDVDVQRKPWARDRPTRSLAPLLATKGRRRL